jgi:hypothetical protein
VRRIPGACSGPKKAIAKTVTVLIDKVISNIKSKKESKEIANSTGSAGPPQSMQKEI